MKKLFIDTGAFLAREIQRDQHHKDAMQAWAALSAAPEKLYTSEHCIDETATLLARRTTYAFAASWGRDLLGSGIIVLRAEPIDLEMAFTTMRKYADQGVSFTDCLSIALMKRHRIAWVFGFDHHFAAAGYRLWPTVR